MLTGKATIARRIFLPILWGVFLFAPVGCGTDTPQSTDRFISNEFNFEISVPQEFSRVGWFIIREQDSALPHQYRPPGNSTFEPVAVVVPSTETAPALAPFFVDIFRFQNPPVTANELGDIRVGQVGENLRSRTSLQINGAPAEELVHGQGDNVTYETFLSREGIGYAIVTLGAPDTSTTATSFFVAADAYRAVARTFRFRE